MGHARGSEDFSQLHNHLILGSFVTFLLLNAEERERKKVDKLKRSSEGGTLTRLMWAGWNYSNKFNTSGMKTIVSVCLERD